MKQVFLQTKYFFFTLTLFWVMSVGIAIFYGYEGSFLLLNAQFHTSVTDFLGIHLTHIADGVIVLLILLICSWDKDKAILLTGIGVVLLTGLVAQILKRGVFSGLDRPALVFEGVQYFVQLLDSPPRHFSFPSGHSTTFAAAGVVFAWFYRGKSPLLQIGVACLTFLLGYTRVHIGVHFLVDVLIGTLLGAFLGAVLIGALYPRFTNYVLPRLSTLDTRLFDGIIIFTASIGLFVRYYFLIT